MSTFFDTILYQPLLNILIVFYSTIALNDLGLAIILLTILIRIIFYPLFYKSYKNQTLLQKIHPEIKKIQEKHKGSREKQAQEMMALYRENKVNPFSSFFLILIQLPVLIALYSVFRSDFGSEVLSDLYNFVSFEGPLNTVFLGLINLKESNIIIVGLAALAQYFQGKLAIPKRKDGGEISPVEKIAKQMVVIGPILTLVVFYSLPSAVGLYWLTTSIFSIFQQILINKSLAKQDGKSSIANKKNN